MAKESHKLNATVRTILGRKVKHLRHEGILPATIYGKNFDPISVQFNCKEINEIFNEVGESGLVELHLEDKKLPIILRNPQYDAIMSELVHIDCYKVNLKEKITATVPIELIGESPAVKEGNTLVEITNEVEVEALPTDLPESITVDISGLEEVDATITVADLNVDRTKVEIITLADQVVVKIEEPRAEEEVVTEEVAPEEVPATAQKTAEEETETSEK